MNSQPLCSSLCWTSVLLAICLACPGLASPLAMQDINWTPGMHSGLPSVQEPGRTFDVYIPTGYQQDYEFGFPTLHVSSPGGNPKLKPYFDWADQNDFILIGFNSSKNGPSDNNIAAQELCLKTVNLMKLNRHPHLNFSTGHSGGGQASWLLATRRPVEFSGMLLTGQRGHSNLPPKHMSVTYVYGDKEPNREYIQDAIKDLRSNGNLVKFQMVPGAHTSGDIKVRLAMIDWMHQNAFMSNLGISDRERIARFDAEVASADEIADVAERLQRYQSRSSQSNGCSQNASRSQKLQSGRGKIPRHTFCGRCKNSI